MENFLLGLSVALTLKNLFYCFLGAITGTVVGLIPGIGPMAALTLLLPFTYALDPVSAIIMMAGVYYGSQYGGSTTAILCKMPGEISSTVSMFDGHALAKKGYAGAALNVSAIGSFIGGCIATGLIVFAGQFFLAIGLMLGPREYMALIFFGLASCVFITNQAWQKSLLMISLGMLLSNIGMDSVEGKMRLTFEIFNLYSGISLVILILGIFGLGESFYNLGKKNQIPVESIKQVRVWSTKNWNKISKCWKSILRASGLGAIFGVLPGGGSIFSSFIAYAVERKLSKNKKTFGKGAIEGVAAAETANNAGAQTSFIPTLSLGIPINPVMALCLALLLVHGVEPGPDIIDRHPELFYALIISMVIGNVFLLAINLTTVNYLIKLLKFNFRYLSYLVIALSFGITYTLNYQIFDCILLTMFGIFGYLLLKNQYNAVPLLLGFVLGPKLEESFRHSMQIFKNNFIDIFISNYGVVFYVMSILLIYFLKFENK